MQDIPTKAKNLKRFPDLGFHSCFTKEHSSRIFKKDLSSYKVQLLLNTPQHSSDFIVNTKEQRFSRQCLPSPETMEANGSSSNSNESQPSGGSNNSSTEKPNEKEIFVNHAEIAWHEKRREWVGDQSQRSRRMPREPIMSWTTTYEDLLLSTEPFQQPIPLAEMVDFLVDIWNEEGLYD